MQALTTLVKVIGLWERRERLARVSVLLCLRLSARELTSATSTVLTDLMREGETLYREHELYIEMVHEQKSPPFGAWRVMRRWSTSAKRVVEIYDVDVLHGVAHRVADGTG